SSEQLTAYRNARDIREFERLWGRKFPGMSVEQVETESARLMCLKSTKLGPETTSEECFDFVYGVVKKREGIPETFDRNATLMAVTALNEGLPIGATADEVKSGFYENLKRENRLLHECGLVRCKESDPKRQAAVIPKLKTERSRLALAKIYRLQNPTWD